MMSTDEYLALNYRKSIYLDEDGSYIVEVDDLPGCIADGETPDEAYANSIAAMRTWIESRRAAGLQIPEPRANDEYSGKFVIRMARSLHKRLAMEAQREEVSLNHYVVTLLTDASANGIAASQIATNEGYFISALHQHGTVRASGFVVGNSCSYVGAGTPVGLYGTYLGSIANQVRTQDMNTPVCSTNKPSLLQFPKERVA